MIDNDLQKIAQIKDKGRGFFSIHPPPEFLPVLGLLKRYMTPTLDAALL